MASLIGIYAVRVSYPSHLFVHHPEETEAYAGPRCVVYDLAVIHLSELHEEGCEAVDGGVVGLFVLVLVLVLVRQ